ncbi:NAD(P)/FAD-dependent oxidoreductase [Pseudooceanicola sp. CBS1P-1]|uniref:Aminoacetone oxidase family FAD-binding enzyme n=1 Tax=Pseudooceanicola albus TaxID=2692189 RepID=A0A6L7FZN8_9RHOB|nr:MULTISPECIES: NAD(P)/FAD-dependent oxidoreductase [Pseudooceanicola]MBT9382588.1 NAD(P)/FAD-dependent oxidoreductase [Pseudooceanicola endophyticus]MXN17129.1 aminoacetone oxidase family FAD-binding enzyme [Pseudooceanicola albus]
MTFDTIILGAGAAGLMCAAHCGGRVLVIDHAKHPGEKIRISGGGRCNFTNTGTGPANFLSANPHFAKSALARYTPWDFVSLVSEHGIAWHEKTLGQLFCDDKATQIVEMLTGLLRKAGAELALESTAEDIRATPGGGYALTLLRAGRRQTLAARRLVVATGGKSIPKMGATGLAYDIARQFGLNVTETRPGLVPLTFPEGRFAALSGTALPARVQAEGPAFPEALLFTHRGLSGPAILQASSYWREGESITVNLSPAADPFTRLRAQRQEAGRKSLTRSLDALLPSRLSDFLSQDWGLKGNLGDQSDRALQDLSQRLTGWQLTPGGSEGYRTAEVTLGGIDTDALNSQSMEAKTQPGLHFIGECVDVTGWLGGYNFQWAWASAMACARAIKGA